MGVKVAAPPEAAGPAAPKPAPFTGRGEVRCWMSSHIYGFTGQLVGMVFLEGGSVRSLLVLYVLDPEKILKAAFAEVTAIKRFKEYFGSLCGSADAFAPVGTEFGLHRVMEVLGDVAEEHQEWEGNRSRALDLLEKYRGAAGPGPVHPAAGLIEPSEDLRRRMSADSGYLRAKQVFRTWLPDHNELMVVVEKMNLISVGKLSTSPESKRAAMDSVLAQEVDAYFAPERRKRMAGALMENAFVAQAARDRVFAQECAALAAVLEDGSVASRSIGFLVECMRGGISLEEPGPEKKRPAKRKGSIIIPGERDEPGAEPEEETGGSLLTLPHSLIEKP